MAFMMTGDHAICFSHSSPLLKRPRHLGSLFSRRTICDHRRYFQKDWSFTSIGVRLPHMCSNDSVVKPHLDSPGGNVLPSGAFAISLRVKFRQEFSIRDQKAILSEYGRMTCAEEGVVRCDILYEVNSYNLAKSKFYDVWATFEDMHAYMEHERSSHASKLRLCLENPSGGDNSVLLTKLAYDVSLLRLVRPEIPGWRSAFDYSNKGNDGTNKLPARPSHSMPSQNRDSESTAAVRRSLNRLISSVGLENVTVLISTATAKCLDSAQKLRQVCKEYLEDLERSAGVIRTGLLVDKNDPYKIFLLTAHDASDDDGACFDMELGRNFVTEDEWKLRRFFAVFPDKGGWEIRVDKDDINAIVGTELTVLHPGKTKSSTQGLVQRGEQGHERGEKSSHTSRQALVQRETPELPAPQSPKMRLLQGSGAFDSVKVYLREMTRMSVGDMRVMIVHGWNASRIHDLIVQLEYDRRNDPGVIDFTTDFNVRSMNVTTERLIKGVAEVHRFRPDVVIGYGGGSVMDMAKAVAHLGRSRETEVQDFTKMINNAAEEGKDCVSVMKSSISLPVMLIPTTIGSGAEITEACIFRARKRDGGWRRIPVHFCDDPDTVRMFTEKTVLVDSRLVGPRRLDGFHAAQGALQLVCLGIDVLISARNFVNEEYVNFALEGISLAFKGVLPALREPYNATGESRDPLVNAKTVIGLARDSVGRTGVCLRLALGIIDSLIDGRYPTMFRTVLIRVTISTLAELWKTKREEDGTKELFALLCNVTNIQEGGEMIETMLAIAEDCNVLLLKELGLVRRLIPEIADNVAPSFNDPECNKLERIFGDPERVRDVLTSAVNQEYKL